MEGECFYSTCLCCRSMYALVCFGVCVCVLLCFVSGCVKLDFVSGKMQLDLVSVFLVSLVGG